MTNVKKLQANEILFREGDASEAMFVVKSGKISIFKQKGSGEIELASLGPGQMLGEMAFFDNKPRSAGARAGGGAEAEVIVLPFKSLNAQFKTFPEWLKAMVKTVNDHLREANKRIKNLEQVNTETRVFPPHTITKLCAILSCVAHRYGEATPEGLIVPSGKLRNYTIQIFGEPTNKMQKLMEKLSPLGYLKVEDLGEGRQKITVFRLNELFDFVDFYNEYLFKEDSKRTTIDEAELRVLRGLLFFAKQTTPDEKGIVKVSLTLMQNESMKALGSVVTVNDVNSLISKGVITDKVSGGNGELFTSFNLNDVARIIPFWELIYTLEKVTK